MCRFPGYFPQILRPFVYALQNFDRIFPNLVAPPIDGSAKCLTLSARADVHVYIRQYTIRDDVYVRRFSTISTRLIVQARIVSVT